MRRRDWIAALLVVVAVPIAVGFVRGMTGARSQTEQPAILAQATPAAGAAAQSTPAAGTNKSVPGIIPGLPGLGGPFTLTDQDGKTRTDREFRGKLLLVTFGFTGCSSICPLQLQKLSVALDQISPEAAKRVVPLFISIDPIGDTPATMHQFLAAFHPSIIGLTGNSAEIDRIVHDYHVHVDPGPVAQSEGKASDIDHSDLEYLMGPDGKFLTLILPNISASDIAARLDKYAART